MVEHLRLRWRDDQSVEALLGLRDELDDILGRIRSTRRTSTRSLRVPYMGTEDQAPIPTSVFARRYERWLVFGGCQRPGTSA
jgi:hypothetical protein